MRRLDDRDLPAIETHLLDLDPVSRNRRFRSGFGDAAVSAYVRRLDLRRAILVGAIEADSRRIVGLAEAHPADAPRTVEIGTSVLAEHRRQGLARNLVGRAIAVAFAHGASTVELLFDPDNYPAARIATGLNARFCSPGHAVLRIPTAESCARWRWAAPADKLAASQCESLRCPCPPFPSLPFPAAVASPSILRAT
jgi:GNAT superfamily N-acetyltransferase